MTIATEAERVQFVVPTGILSVSGTLKVEAVIRSSARSKESVRLAVEAITRSHSRFFLPAREYLFDAEGFHLNWPPLPSGSVPLTVLAAKWRQEPAAHVWEALGLARHLCAALSNLDFLQPLPFLISPLQVFRHREAGPQWLILLVPLQGAGAADFVAASDLAITWASGDELLRIGFTDRAYVMGAVLYYSLVADLFPADLARAERLRRCISYCGGERALLTEVLQTSLPKGCSEKGRELCEFTLKLLSPAYERGISPVQAVRQLESFEEEFAPPRLAALWESENQAALALQVLNTFAADGPPEEVPWKDVERLRRLFGDVQGADAAKKRIRLSLGEQKDEFIREVRAAAGSGDRAFLEEAVGRLSGEQTGQPLDEETVLYLTYVNARFLQRMAESLQMLKREFTISWNKVVREALNARLAAESGNWSAVAMACRDARKIIAKWPDPRNEQGSYLRGYLALLDGIAHIDAVQTSVSFEYYNDAFMWLQTALQEAQDGNHQSLARAVAFRLGLLAQAIQPHQSLSTLQLYVDALCASLGIRPGLVEGDLTIPWFDEEQLFPCLIRSTR